MASSHIVSGRFDLIGHSMGGLVARHYATTVTSEATQTSDASLGYRNYRNRNQGAFGTVVMIDTPHEGTKLANYLIDNAQQTLTAPPEEIIVDDNLVPTNRAWILWRLNCDPVDDSLQTCFYKVAMPFAPSGINPDTGLPWAPDSGAVGSIQATYSGIIDPNKYPILIPNTNQGFISACYEDSTQSVSSTSITACLPDSTKDTSVLRSVLNTFVNAIQWNQGNSLTQILGDAANDVLVTVSSQNPIMLGGVPWPDLEHTGVFETPTTKAAAYESILNLVTFSDANVLISPGVNQMIMCFLASGGTSNCPPPPSSSTSISMARLQSGTMADKPCGPTPSIGISIGNGSAANTPLPVDPRVSVPCAKVALPQAKSRATIPKTESRTFLVNDRVEMIVPVGKVLLGEETEIPLVLHAQGLVSVSSSQLQFHGVNEQMPDPVYGSGIVLPILHHLDGSAYINIVPMRLGKVQLSIAGRFDDGGIFTKRVILDVDQSSRKPLKVSVGESPIIFMYLGGRDRRALYVNAVYENISAPVSINAAFVRYKVRTNDNASVIHLDKSTGIITPVGVGHALVETWFEGKKNLTCVVVKNNGGTYDRSRCQDLLASGEEIPVVQ